jgi:hypothetical protein
MNLLVEESTTGGSSFGSMSFKLPVKTINVNVNG